MTTIWINKEIWKKKKIQSALSLSWSKICSSLCKTVEKFVYENQTPSPNTQWINTFEIEQTYTPSEMLWRIFCFENEYKKWCRFFLSAEKKNLPFDEEKPFMTNCPSTMTRDRIPHPESLSAWLFWTHDTQSPGFFLAHSQIDDASYFAFSDFIRRHQKLICDNENFAQNIKT